MNNINILLTNLHCIFKSIRFSYNSAAYYKILKIPELMRSKASKSQRMKFVSRNFT